MLKSLKNIESSFSLMKSVLIVVVIAATLVSVCSLYWAFTFAEKQREKIYVLDEGRALSLALAQDVYENRMAEARAVPPLFLHSLPVS